MQAGDLDTARAIVDTSVDRLGLAAARVDIALSCGDVASARRSLESWQPESDDLVALVARLLRWTSVLDAEGEQDLSRAAIGEAVALAETEQLRWPFLEAPAALNLLRQGPWSNGALLKPLLGGQRLSLDARKEAQAHLVEQLTARELEILVCLPGRARNHEVAASLYISANTLKSHLRSIYRKLDVADRDEAVRRATELGLL